MYLSKVRLQNIRSFEDTTVEFEPKEGWNVILGDNGSGKSTLIRSVALGLIGEDDIKALGLEEDWDNWLRYKETKGIIELDDQQKNKLSKILLEEERHALSKISRLVNISAKTNNIENTFSASYGALRRAKGGNKDYDNVWKNNPKLAAHLSIFFEDVALDQIDNWVEDMQRIADFGPYDFEEWRKEFPAEQVESDIRSVNNTVNILDKIFRFVNDSAMFDTSYKFKKTGLSGPFFLLGDIPISIHNLSDGYKSILTLVLELLRQLFRIHNDNLDKIFSEVDNKLKVIASGIVLIDEVAAHLHPSWQARIGEWLTEYFPNIQFIVSTHSPIICRSAKNGSIQKIVYEEGSTSIVPVTEDEKYTLIYGNILDAYETNLFGRNIIQSSESLEKFERLAQLKARKQYNQTLSNEEEQELNQLLKIFSANVIDPFA